ncbi:synaptobrevin (macronuclear) [Tetrahymena thermophila SB210]|uniref:Synaptobrevin n=1 Tax=Tetrahymena thermophila (strain SB210) TaxID=312017 RepID=I7MLJ7_TETTS|nr:synaptobrevin [Tetrahymena thermophila SB210]EAS02424.2 synaptobrevin [Tetrahymena thermophila SB210]|eukprot:XP_001022669.2 synaptobrevin [Tetrahymena thermophila SB210]
MNQSHSIFQTTIVRAQDGLVFCEYTTEGAHIQPEISGQLKKFIKNDSLFKQNQDFRLVEFGNYTIGYLVQDDVVFIALVSSTYDVKLCRQYVKDIQQGFTEELKNTFGTTGVNYYSKLSTIETPYSFIKFDRYIKRKCKEFSDQRSQANIDRIKNDMTDIHEIMTQVFSKVMDRTKNLNELNENAAGLKDFSKIYVNKTKNLAWQMWLKKNAVYFILIILLCLFILFKII